MPFNGGGGGALPPHEHTNIANDGGPLDFNNTTIASMNSGDMTYSDGVALQQLAIAAPNDQLRVSAGNIPEWFTPAAGASTWTTLADVTLGAPGTLDTGVFAAHDVLAIYIFAALTVADGQAIIFNSDNAANQYCFRDIRNGTGFSTANYPCIQFGFAATTNWINSAWTITQRTSNEKMINGFVTEQTGTASTDIPSQALLSAMWRNTANQITRVTSANSAGTIVNMATGSRIVVLGAS